MCWQCSTFSNISRTPAKPQSLEKKEKLTALKKKNNLSEDFEVKSSQKKKLQTKAEHKIKSKSKRAAGKELKKENDAVKDTKKEKEIPTMDTFSYSSTPGNSILVPLFIFLSPFWFYLFWASLSFALSFSLKQWHLEEGKSSPTHVRH